MMTLNYRIEFFDYWLCAAGISAGFDVDEKAIRDPEGFPFVPGTTMKGLLREAAETFEKLQPAMEWKSFIIRYFGSRSDEGGKKRENHLEWDLKPVNSRKAGSWFSNAELSQGVKDHLTDKSIPLLFSKRSSTAIVEPDNKKPDKEAGTALENSLRRIEVTVPLFLYGRIEGLFENEEDRKMMEMCFKWIKRLGNRRTRGLGRCQISMVSGEEEIR